VRSMMPQFQLKPEYARPPSFLWATRAGVWAGRALRDYRPIGRSGAQVSPAGWLVCKGEGADYQVTMGGLRRLERRPWGLARTVRHLKKAIPRRKTIFMVGGGQRTEARRTTTKGGNRWPRGSCGTISQIGSREKKLDRFVSYGLQALIFCKWCSGPGRDGSAAWIVGNSSQGAAFI